MKHAPDHRAHNLLRWMGIGIGVALFFALITTGQTRIPSVFASPQSTPVPTVSSRGIHLGNHYYSEEWPDALLQRIDGAKAGGIWPTTVVVLSQNAYSVIRSGASCRVERIEPRHSNIIDYLQRASLHGSRIIIRIFPSPGHFDSNHHLQVGTASGCDADHLRSYDDIGDEIVKIHEWNAQNSITEFGFEPASEPNAEWYSLSTHPPISDQIVWVEMDAYFSAIYDYVHVRYPTGIRVLTPPMAQGDFAELYNVNGCGPMGLNDGKSGYEKMANIFLNGTKNDGYDWHNYWKLDYESWASCDDAASPHGQHVSYWFPPAMWASMAVKPRNITEADLDSPPSVNPNHFGDLADKDVSFGSTASDSLNKFINAEQWADRIAVWSLNITDPTSDPGVEQNWHEAYRCNDIGQDGFILSERPWFMRWWSGIPAVFSFTPCYRVFLPVGSNNYTTELIKNGNFDASGAYWTATTSQTSCRYPDNYPYPIFDVLDGNNAARMGRCTSNMDTLSQTITIPSNATNAQLTFQFRVEQSYSQPYYYDGLYIKIWDRNTSELVQLTSYTDSPPRYVWRASSTLDLTARRGHTLDVILSATNNSDLWPTKFWIDDVSVQIAY